MTADLNKINKLNKRLNTLSGNESFVKLPNALVRNPLYQKWRGTARGSLAEFLLGYIIRGRTNSPVANKILDEFYIEKRLLVARFDNDTLAQKLGYKDRRGIIRHITQLQEEGIIKIHDINNWYDYKVRLFEVGKWKMDKQNRYIEIIHMYSKFHKMLAEKNLNAYN